MKKLLVLDDSAEMRDAVEAVFSLYNFSVRTAKDHKSFLVEFASFKPEVVILDVLLSGEDGINICKALRKDPSNNTLAIVLFSASPKHLENFEKYGADAMVEKPFSIKEFIEKIETAILSRNS